MQERRDSVRKSAVAHKERGNFLFKQGKFEPSVNAYSKAIELDPADATFYNNRAAALLKLFRFEEAEADCDRVLHLGKDFNVKALLRRGAAREALKKYMEAEKDYKHVLQQEPGNREARIGLQSVRAALEGAGGGMGSADFIGM